MFPAVTALGSMYTSSCVLTSDSCTEEFESVPLPCTCDDNCLKKCSCWDTEVYTNGKLAENYSNDFGKPIIECSNLCSCTEECSNRIVQQGICFSLQVFMTMSRGFGVRTMEFIPKSSFVCEYAGEVIDVHEAKKRLAKQEFDCMNYIFVIREYCSKEVCKRTIIDPTIVGNIGRYLNHSCSPNLISVPVRSNSMVPKICFFANCDIDPLQELTYDYGGSSEIRNANIKKLNLISADNARKCLCGSKNCTAYLPFSNDLL
ncbi:histone-lysine N-methyltransferase SETMAR isoform X2 [Parasteatoda tepidariorum]|uniref:histone-lysine N-methyltransferase SETMAR isoform X2 n=1 Tax=Parasteatoda tepidariorum TaxID=114398 RepID=UPI00077F9063|nr:histone-lysine N-methyltransferase SETMAR isoform X2 [Parasteatoda tepidariorum]